jgi:three-Cys-motif partner protein
MSVSQLSRLRRVSTGRIMTENVFGGDWTRDKLERVRKYLCAYMTIFKKNSCARYFKTIYVDAFAGTGQRVESARRRSKTAAMALEDDADADKEALQKGSARIALEVAPPFDQFLFIERSPKRIKELEKLKSEFPNLADRIQIEQGDANDVLQRWGQRTDWRRHRAVVFLDPYGMQVEWTTIKVIAATKAIDLWLLFPLGVAVNRLLTRNKPPPKKWADALTRFFGNEDWRQEFYPKKTKRTLFGVEETARKEANFERIGRFFLKQLKTVFAGVAPNPLILSNSKGVPLYLLCFAAGNPKGSPTAVKIAKDILK